MPSTPTSSNIIPIKDEHLFKSKDEFVNYFYADKKVDWVIREYVKEHGEDKKFVKDALKIQKKYLDKHSDTIKGNLMKIWNSAKTVGSKVRGKFRHGGFDEAIVDNIKVEQLIFTVGTSGALFGDILNEINIKLIDNGYGKNVPKNLHNLYKPIYLKNERLQSAHFYDLFKFIDSGKTKGLPFTFMSSGKGFTQLKNSFKYDKELWEHLSKHGYKRDKSVFIRKS
jgi:hypothetical protein